MTNGAKHTKLRVRFFFEGELRVRFGRQERGRKIDVIDGI